MDRIKFKVSGKSNEQVAAYIKAARLAAQNQHVIPKDGQWAVKRADSSKVTRIFTHQKEAIAYGRNLARNQRTELLIHTREGQIRDRKSYHRP